MTSDEIRESFLREAKQTDSERTYHPSNRIGQSHDCTKIEVLAEIAAQLAELNEHFRKADESVFGVKDTKPVMCIKCKKEIIPNNVYIVEQDGKYHVRCFGIKP